MKVLQTNGQRCHVSSGCIYYLFIAYLFRVIPHSERIRASRFRKCAVSTEESKNVTRAVNCTGL